MNAEIPEIIIKFLKEDYTLSFSCRDGEYLHSVTVYYSFCDVSGSLIFASQNSSLHSGILRKNPLIAGTVYRKTRNIKEIHGLQFTGHIHLLTKSDGQYKEQSEETSRVTAEKCINNYLKTFPEAENTGAEFWEIQFDYIKFTDNSVSFGHKTIWQRES
jgi:uncharacterized protein